MEKEEIIEIIKENSNSYIEPHKDKFYVICWYVQVNKVCIRDVYKLRFVEDVLWINDEISIDLKAIESFSMMERTICKKED